MPKVEYQPGDPRRRSPSANNPTTSGSSTNTTSNIPETTIGNVMRERQWVYLGPIFAAPAAHIAVSLYKRAKTPGGRRLLLWGGVVGATVGSISMRLYLLHDAGLPGGEGDAESTARLATVSSARESEAIANPGWATVLKEMVKGMV